MVLNEVQKLSIRAHAISVPIGESTLGRMFNVTGDPIDGKEGEFTIGLRYIDHHLRLVDQSGSVEIS